MKSAPTLIMALLVILLYHDTYAQTQSFYADATKNPGFGYSYTVSLHISKYSKGDHTDQFSDRVLLTYKDLEVDPKGYFYSGKYYTAEQLGSACNPFHNYQIFYEYEVERNGIKLKESGFMLENIGKTQVISWNKKNDQFLGITKVWKHNSLISDQCRKRIGEILNPPKVTRAENTSSGNKTKTTKNF